MVTATDNFITVQGIKLQYTEFGARSSPHMLCLHGFTLEAHSWDALAERMSARYHIVCPTLPGHGDSDRRESYDDQFADIHLLAAFMDAVEMPSATVLGHSMGGAIGGGLAVFYPAKVERLVFVDAGIDTKAPGMLSLQQYFDAWQPEHDSFDEALRWAQSHWPRTTEPAHRSWLQHGGEVLANGRFRWKLDPVRMKMVKSPQPPPPDDSPLWPFVAQIKPPTLVLRGEVSDVVTPEHAARLVATLPDGHLATVRGVAHGMQLESVDAVYDGLKEFLDLP